MLSRQDVRRAVERFPNEPIVRVRWSPLKGVTETVLWTRGADALRKRHWRAAQVTRQDDDSEILYASEEGYTITRQDVERAVEDGCRRVPGEDDEPGMCDFLKAEEVEEERGILGRVLARIRGE
jgi:ribosomal protein L15E